MAVSVDRTGCQNRETGNYVKYNPDHVITKYKLACNAGVAATPSIFSGHALVCVQAALGRRLKSGFYNLPDLCEEFVRRYRF